MNSRERIFTMLEGTAVGHLPDMPITMMFAADQVGAKYFEYATDYHAQVEGQIRVAERFCVDQVSVISDPCCEAADLGATLKFFPDQPPAIDEENAFIERQDGPCQNELPDPLGGGRTDGQSRAGGRPVEGARRRREGNRGLDRGTLRRICGPARHQPADARLL
jgi:Uroporphyrinogen decarboxylase (URO-D)